MIRRLPLFPSLTLLFGLALLLYVSCIQSYIPVGLACRTDTDCWDPKTYVCDLTRNTCAPASTPDASEALPEKPTPDASEALPEKPTPDASEALPEKAPEEWPHDNLNCKTPDQNFCKNPLACVTADPKAFGELLPLRDYGFCICEQDSATNCPAPYNECLKVEFVLGGLNISFFKNDKGEAQPLCVKSCTTNTDCPKQGVCVKNADGKQFCVPLELMGIDGVLEQPCGDALPVCPSTTTCCRKNRILTDRECRSGFVAEKQNNKDLCP